MEFVLSEAKFFKSCVDAVSNLIDEGAFQVGKDGLHLRAMDPSQIAMVDFTLPKEAFERIEVEDKASIGVNLADLVKILARARPDEKLTIKIDEKESRLSLEFKGQTKRRFKMPLLDTNTTLPKEPKVAFDADVKIRGGTFKDLLRDAALLSSHVVLEAEDSRFTVEAHGDSGDMHSELEKASGELADIKVTAKSRAMFPHEYLDDISRACPDDSAISISLKNDAPVKISYGIDKAKLSYFLAPRVESA